MVPTLSAMQKRLKFQASRRSTREMEELLLPLIEHYLPQFDDADCEKVLKLLDWPDIQLYDWITGLQPAPAGVDVAMLQRLHGGSHPLCPS